MAWRQPARWLAIAGLSVLSGTMGLSAQAADSPAAEAPADGGTAGTAPAAASPEPAVSPAPSASPAAAAPGPVNPYPAESPAWASPAAAGAGGSAAPNPFPAKPYGEDEFPDWLKKLRRFEVIAVGAFPLAYMNSNLFYDVGRWGFRAIQYAANDYSLAAPTDTADRGSANWHLKYAPLFFAPPNKPPNEQDENLGIVLASIGLSLGVAAIDLIIGLVEDAAKQALADQPGAAP
jgi:hypothetical protein